MSKKGRGKAGSMGANAKVIEVPDDRPVIVDIDGVPSGPPTRVHMTFRNANDQVDVFMSVDAAVRFVSDLWKVPAVGSILDAQTQ